MASISHLLLPRPQGHLIPRDNHDDDDDHHGLSGWAIFIIVVVILLVVGAGTWFLWAYLRNKRSPSNVPAPRPGGIIGWVNDKVRSFKNRRYAAGAYEGTSGEALGSRRGRAMDPDEAWDTRVGNEADVYGPGGFYEEQELGLHPPTGGATAYSGTGYGAPAPSPGFGLSTEPERGRSRSRQRELDDRYDEEMDRSSRSRNRNPFGDDAAVSMRGVSPRPLDTSGAHDRLDGGHSAGNSPTERRSMFREAV